MPGYHDDCQFVAVGVVPACRGRWEQRWSGTCSLEFNLAGRMAFGIDHGPETVLAGPFAFWHHPRHSYQYGSVDDGGWHQHFVLMRGTRPRRMLEEALMPLAPAGHLAVGEAAAFAGTLRTLIDLVRAGDPGRHAEAVALLETLVARLVVWARAGDRPRHGGIAALVDLIQADPGRDFDFAAEAARLGITAAHFRRLFVATTGSPPLAYLLDRRVRQAAHDLADPDLTVAAVARRCGWADPVRFSKVFAARMGLSPRAFRRSLPAAGQTRAIT